MKNKKNQKLTRNEKRRNLIIKWGLYLLLACIAYTLCTASTTATVRPLTLIPLALCISMYEKLEIVAAVTGGVCGLILDSACDRLFGFNAFLLTALSLMTALFFLYLLRRNFINILWICASSTIIHALLDYLFFYAIWNYDDSGYIFLHYTIPSVVVTIIACPVVYLLVYFVNKKFGEQDEHFLAEQNENIVRE